MQTPNWVETANKVIDADNEWFKKSMAGAMLGFAVFMALSWLWPKPQDELVPPQLAKIILAPVQQKSTPQAEKASEMANANSKLPEKVQNAAVVQA